MKSEITKKYKRLYLLYSFLGFLVLFAPLIAYLIMGLMAAETVQKVTLGFMFSAALIISLVNILFKTHYRSAVWVAIIGIYFCIQEIMPLLLSIAAATILDEFIFTPLARSCKNKFTINDQIDRRL